jgi:hypothetical protein
LEIIVPEDHAFDEPASDNGQPKESTGFVQDRTWTVEPPLGVFAIAAGEEKSFPFEVRLKKAFFGKQPIRVDFKIQADEPYNFSVYTDLEVGTGDLTLDVGTRLNDDGALIVEQLMTNRAERLADFRCYLYSKVQRPQRMQVYRLGSNVDRKIYRLRDGKRLVGQEMLLEIEELNGPRFLRYRFVATDGSENKSQSETAEAAPTSPAAEPSSQHQAQVKLDG